MSKTSRQVLLDNVVEDLAVFYEADVPEAYDRGMVETRLLLFFREMYHLKTCEGCGACEVLTRP